MEKKRAKFIQDCNEARDKGFYNFLCHLTQGFRWNGTEWCENCLRDAYAWWRMAQLADQHDPELYQHMLEESQPEVERFLEHSQRIRDRNAARRAATAPSEPVDQPPEPKQATVTGGRPPKVEAPDPTPTKKYREREAEQKAKDKKKEQENKPRNQESSFLETTSKILRGLAHWVATGK